MRMQRCKENRPEVKLPVVKPGDLVEVQWRSGQGKCVYLVGQFGNQMRMFNVTSGMVWSSDSLWGSINLNQAERVAVVTDRFSLIEEGC